MATALEQHEANIAALKKELAALEEKSIPLRIEEAKVLADAFIDKLEKKGLTIQDGINALNALKKVAEPESGKQQRAKRGEGKPRNKSLFEKGGVYRDPEGKGKDYIGGALGAKPKWLQDAQKSGADVSTFLAQSTGTMTVS